MGDVAERVLMLVELAVFRQVDAPVLDILAFMVAWRQPQRLDHAARGFLVAVDGLVRNPDAQVGATIEKAGRRVKPESSMQSALRRQRQADLEAAAPGANYSAPAAAPDGCQAQCERRC